MDMKILVTPKSFKNYKDKAYPLLQAAGCDVIENTSGKTFTEDEIIAVAHAGVCGIIVGIDPLSERVLRNLKDLKAISKYGVGLDNIALDVAKELSITVMTAAGSNDVSVAEMTIALMFEAARHVSVLSASVKSGRWERALGIELTGKTLGLVGCGKIGKEVAKRARGLGMQVSFFDPRFSDLAFQVSSGLTRAPSLDILLAVSDIISLHVPLTADSKHLLNRRSLALMKPSAVLLNTSRGELVDEEALYEALASKQIAFAAADVFSAEPPPPGTRLLDLDNFVLTPHAAAYTAEANERMAMYSTKNLITMLQTR